MNFAPYALPAAGAVIILVGVGCGLGSKILWNGKPENWTDVIAGDTLARKVAFGLLIVSALSIAAGASATLGLPYSRAGGTIAILAFVVGGFLGNYKLFGDIRPKHTGPNTVIALIVLWLLWVGSQS